MAYDPQSTEGLTEHGQERIAELRSDHLFTSDLSVNEFLLVKEAGFEPLGFVVGSCIYHIGFQHRASTRARRWKSCRRRCTTPASSR